MQEESVEKDVENDALINSVLDDQVSNASNKWAKSRSNATEASTSLTPLSLHCNFLFIPMLQIQEARLALLCNVPRGAIHSCVSGSRIRPSVRLQMVGWIWLVFCSALQKLICTVSCFSNTWLFPQCSHPQVRGRIPCHCTNVGFMAVTPNFRGRVPSFYLPNGPNPPSLWNRCEVLTVESDHIIWT